MWATKAREKARRYFESGFHCAEAVAQAIVGLHGSEEDASEAQRFAAGFMGGIGGTQQEACGALTGGIIAIGCLRGRRQAGQDNQEIKDLATEFRSCFKGEFDATRCCDVLEKLGEREDGLDCEGVTAIAAGLLSDLLTERSV